MLSNLQLTADFAGLLILDNQPHKEIKHNERGYMDNINFKKRNLHSTLPSSHTHKWRCVKLTNIQNEKLDKLTYHTQPWKQAKWNTNRDGWTWEWVESSWRKNPTATQWDGSENKSDCFQLDRHEHCIRESILIYGVEDDKEDNDDGEKSCSK